MRIPSKPTVYLFGDAGYDEFDNGSTKVKVPSGTFFLRDVLTSLLANNIDIECLVSEEEHGDAAANALPQRRALLKKYGTTWRVVQYDVGTAQVDAKIQ